MALKITITESKNNLTLERCNVGFDFDKLHPTIVVEICGKWAEVNVETLKKAIIFLEEAQPKK